MRSDKAIARFDEFYDKVYYKGTYYHKDDPRIAPKHLYPQKKIKKSKTSLFDNEN